MSKILKWDMVYTCTVIFAIMLFWRRPNWGYRDFLYSLAGSSLRVWLPYFERMITNLLKKDSNYVEEFQIWGVARGEQESRRPEVRGRVCDVHIFRCSLRGWGEGLRLEVSTLKMLPGTETFMGILKFAGGGQSLCPRRREAWGRIFIIWRESCKPRRCTRAA